jgi:hypothetical protein
VSGLRIDLDPAALEPLVSQIVAKTIAALDAERARLGDQIAFSEETAARLLELEPHQLADERRRGRIKASQVVGRRIRYLRQDLLEYMMTRRWSPEKNGRDQSDRHTRNGTGS